MELMLRKSERLVHEEVERVVHAAIDTKSHSRLLVLTEMAEMARAFPQGCYEETVFATGFDPRV